MKSVFASNHCPKEKKGEAMNSRISLKSVVTFLCAGAIVFSACRPAGGAEISKEEIIQKAWKAMFGELKNEDVKSFYVEALFHGATVPSRMTVKRPNLFRNEVSSGVLVFDGKRAAWAKQGPDEKGNPRGPELIGPESWRHFEVDIAVLIPAFFDYPAEYKGRETEEGTEAHVLRVDLPLGSFVTYFVDAKTFLVTKRLVNWNGVEGEDWENLLDDYADFNGIRFPTACRYPGRNGQEKGTYQNVKININPADELFVLPAGLEK